MDIQYQSTPLKKIKDIYSTPPKYTQNKRKNQIEDDYSTPVKNDNPQSKRLRNQQENIQSSSKKTRNFLNEPTSIKKTPVSAMKRSPDLPLKLTRFSSSRLDQDYTIIKALGQGCFSTVFLCQSKLSGDLFAIKQTKSSSMSINEVQALGTLSIFAQKSKNIVRYYHSWQEEGNIYIVMQYCEKNLTKVYNDFRESRKYMSEQQIKNILKQGLMGIKCMHENKMVHLDIKPDNMLFKDQVLKIADLGLCRVTRIKRWGQLDEGDSRYLAKEILNYHEGMDLTKADIFSLGMAIYEGLILTQLPNNGQKWQQLRDNGLDFFKIAELYSKQLRELLQKMTLLNWNDRPSATQLLKAPYFSQQKSRTKLNRTTLLLKKTNQTRGKKKQQASL